MDKIRDDSRMLKESEEESKTKISSTHPPTVCSHRGVKCRHFVYTINLLKDRKVRYIPTFRHTTENKTI